jgi:hypothetical protein
MLQELLYLGHEQRLRRLLSSICLQNLYRATQAVLDPGKGVCVVPVGRDATLGVGGPGPPAGAGERQLSLDRGGEKT